MWYMSDSCTELADQCADGISSIPRLEGLPDGKVDIQTTSQALANLIMYEGIGLSKTIPTIGVSKQNPAATYRA